MAHPLTLLEVSNFRTIRGSVSLPLDASVVLIHGINNCMEDWLLNIAALARNHRVYALDLIGHGRTDKPLSNPYRPTDFARFVKDFMDALQIQSAHLVGHSLGGAVALMVAINYPSTVNRLVLVDSAGIARQVSVIFKLLSIPGVGEALGTMVFQGALQKRVALQRQSWPDPKIVPDEMIRRKVLAFTWQDIRKPYYKALRASCNILGMKKSAYLPIRQGLPNLKNPTLVIWGERDGLLPASLAQVLKDNLPDVRVVLFENCKHNPMVTEPQRFNRLVGDFLSGDHPNDP